MSGTLDLKSSAGNEQGGHVPAAQAMDEAGVWSAMSHEIRTPLMGVIGMLEILARTPLTDEQRRIIATAGESSSALIRIVDDVLDLAKLESARLALSPVSTNLAELLEGCSELLGNQAEFKGIAVICEADFSVPPVRCDAVRLRQVILNLGTNAIKFTDSGNVMLSFKAVDVTSTHARMRFTIADTGIGIPQDLHPFLFQPFSQLTIAAGRGLGGVGLGLAICRNLVEAMDGKISLESKPGVGTRFYIDLCFPLALPTFAPVETRLDDLQVVAVDAGESGLHVALRYLESSGALIRRVEALHDLASLNLGSGNLVVVVGPDAEPEDVEVVTSTLRLRTPPEKVPILWLHPRALGNAASLARRGVRAVRAHPLRRADLLEAVLGAHAIASSYGEAPLLTRRLAPHPSFGDQDVAAAARAEGRVILVAEDNIINQQVLRQQLAILGFDCDMAGTGAAALQALRERSYLLLLCDCHMPGIDGFELTRLIRVHEGAETDKPESHGKTYHLPIIAITANAMPGEEQRCRAAGMDDYLAKPIEIRGLQAALERWIDLDLHPMYTNTGRDSQSNTLAAAKTEVSPSDGIDLRNLRALFGNDSTRLKPVLEQWRLVIGESSQDLRAALADAAWDAAYTATHRLKGSAGIAGAHRLAAAAAALENVIQTRDRDGIAREGERVLTLADAALREIQAGALQGSAVARSG